METGVKNSLHVLTSIALSVVAAPGENAAAEETAAVRIKNRGRFVSCHGIYVSEGEPWQHVHDQQALLMYCAPGSPSLKEPGRLPCTTSGMVVASASA